MPERIPQSVAYTVVFKAYLSDGVTPATGKTIAATISKNVAAFGNPSAGATNATEIASGWYYVDLSATDTGTLGPLIFHGAVTGVDTVDLAFYVVNANNAGFAGLPNAAADAAGGLPISDAGGLDMDNLDAATADRLLGRNLAGGADGGRTVTQALRLLRNLRRLASGFLNVYREDDATLDWQLPVETSPRDPLERIG